MTSLAQKKRGYILPEVIDDGTRYCVTIQVPTDPNHIRAFWGALYELANAWNWAWDGNKTGSTVAFLWQDLVDEAFTLMTYEECMDFCQRVADCLTNNANTRNALADAIRDLFPEIDKPTPVNPVNPTLPILPPPVSGCDLDKLWGQVVSIITRMNTNNKDFLEAYSSDNFLKLVSEAIQLIPAVDALAIDDWLRLNQEIAQYALSSYLSYETDEVLLDLQCLLFCLSRDNCSINIQGLADVFNQSFNTVIDLSSLGSALQFFIDVVTGDFTDRKIFEALWCIQLIGVVYGLPFFQTTQTDVLLYAALGNDTPSPDWELLCTDCNPVITWQIASFGGNPTVVPDGDYYIITCTVPSTNSEIYRSQIYIEGKSDGVDAQNVITMDVDTANSNFGIEEDYNIPGNTNGIYPYNGGSHGWINDSRYSGNTLVVLRVKVLGGTYDGIRN
jgi:hypothetical protein